MLLTVEKRMVVPLLTCGSLLSRVTSFALLMGEDLPQPWSLSPTTATSMDAAQLDPLSWTAGCCHQDPHSCLNTTVPLS